MKEINGREIRAVMEGGGIHEKGEEMEVIKRDDHIGRRDGMTCEEIAKKNTDHPMVHTPVKRHDLRH